jgi:hypothetical protein
LACLTRKKYFLRALNRRQAILPLKEFPIAGKAAHSAIRFDREIQGHKLHPIVRTAHMCDESPHWKLRRRTFG